MLNINYYKECQKVYIQLQSKFSFLVQYCTACRAAQSKYSAHAVRPN